MAKTTVALQYILGVDEQLHAAFSPKQLKALAAKKELAAVPTLPNFKGLDAGAVFVFCLPG